MSSSSPVSSFTNASQDSGSLCSDIEILDFEKLENPFSLVLGQDALEANSNRSPQTLQLHPLQQHLSPQSLQQQHQQQQQHQHQQSASHHALHLAYTTLKTRLKGLEEENRKLKALCSAKERADKNNDGQTNGPVVQENCNSRINGNNGANGETLCGKEQTMEADQEGKFCCSRTV